MRNMATELCLVTGATGAIGPLLVKELVRRGESVRGVARHVPPVGLLPNSVQILAGDISDDQCARDVVDGVKIVFHLAARLHITDPKRESTSESQRVNVEGTKRLVEACLAANVKRLVYFSTISVYGPTKGRNVDEDATPCPESIYGMTKLAGEREVLAAQNTRSGEPLGVVLRLAAVYGPRMKGNYRRLVKGLSSGLFIPVGDGTNRRTLVYEQDAVHAALIAAQHPAAAGRIYNVSDGEVHSLDEIITSISSVIGISPPSFFLPVRPMRWLSKGVDLLMGMVDSSPGLTTMIDKFAEDVAVRSDRIKRELAFQPAYSLDEGLRQTIRAWKDSAELR
jgi:nucleoside-diphosphate-sugar epimerase